MTEIVGDVEGGTRPPLRTRGVTVASGAPRAMTRTDVAETRGRSDSEGLHFKARLWCDHGLYMLCAEAATLTLCFSFAARAFGAAALEAGDFEIEEE